MGEGPLLGDIRLGLLGDHRALHACQHRFGFGQRQSQICGAQDIPLDARHLFEEFLFPTIRFNDDVDTHLHTSALYCTARFRRLRHTDATDD
jgi:hypothetical protein